MAHKGFIELGRKPSKETTQPSAPKEVYYPSFYVDNKDLGLDANDAGKEIMAVVKLKVRRVGKEATENKKTDTASFDVVGINLSPGRISHYGKK